MLKLFKYVAILVALMLLPAVTSFANVNSFRERVADMAVVRSIRVGASLEKVRIVIDASKQAEYKTMVLVNPGRVVVDIKNAWVSPEVSRETMISSRFASKVRVGQFDDHTVRIVVETTVKKGNYNIFPLNIEGALPRLVLDFGSINTDDKGSLQNYAEEVKKDDVEQKSPKKLPEPIITPGLKGKKIIIDPGHGGEDSGAIGPSGITEKSITMRISNELKKILEDAGAKIILTRTTDTEVSPKHRQANDVEELQARCDIANKENADIFVCIHMDSFTSNVANGTTGFYYSRGTEASKRLAEAVQRGVISKLGTENRGTKKCNFYVLKHTKMPATLIEVAFLSNPAEEKMMNSNVGINKAAQGIYEGIANFFG